MSTRTTFEPAELLAHVGWVRSLALRVARDAHAADDLAQDAFVVALSREAPRARSVKRWLGAVVRNLARTSVRSERRRAAREAAVERCDVSASTLEVVERAASERELVGALLELDEPYRSTLLLRFFEELAAREVAARTGVPESTVATRTAEGLRRLRRRFGGSKRDTLAAILATVPRPKGALPSGTTSGAPWMTLSTQALAASGLVAGALLTYVAVSAPSTRGGDGSLTADRSAAAETTKVQGVGAARATRRPLETRRAAGGPAPVGPAGTEPDRQAHARGGGARVAVGRVVDVSGAAVPSVEVCRVGSAAPLDANHAGVPRSGTDCVHSDATGAFRFQGGPPFELEVHDARYATVFRGHVYPETSDREPVIVVAERIRSTGLVVDEHGHGVPGAQVAIHLAGRLLPQTEVPLAASTLVSFRATSDAEGRFAFAEAPRLPDAILHASAPGFLPGTTRLSAGDGARVVLRRSAEDVPAIAGSVCFRDGRAASGAWVSMGWAATRADDDGRFVLELAHSLHFVEPDQPLELVALHPGHRPAILEMPTVAQAQVQGWPSERVLSLGGPTGVIRGRVVDERGEPVAGVTVDVLGGMEFGLVPRPMSGGLVMRTREEVAGGGEVRSDARGEFELRGLLRERYELEALERPSLLRAVTAPVRVGSDDVEIVLDRGDLGRIAGHVVDRHGAGIGGVQVSVTLRRRGYLAIGIPATTADDGSFVMDGVTTSPELLRLVGEAIVPELFRELSPDARLEALELSVGRRCYVQIDWGDAGARADELRVLDGDGRALELVSLEGGGIGTSRSLQVEEGLSAVFAVSDAAANVVLLRGEGEVERAPLRLEPGELELLGL